jgi:hypothetical protein
MKMKKMTLEGFVVRRVGLCRNDSLAYRVKIEPLSCLRCGPWILKAEGLIPSLGD